MRRIFFDTSGIIASLNEDDVHYLDATKLMEELQTEDILVTTDFVIAEFLNAFAKVPLRKKAYELLQWIENSPSVIVERIDIKRYQVSLNHYRKYQDKDWSFTDCSSFVVMKEMEIREAFTHDKHFEQAGFIRLLT